MMSQRKTARTARRAASRRSQSSQSRGPGAEQWIALALCAAMLLAWTVQLLVPNRPDYAQSFAPDWLPLAAASLAVAGIVLTKRRPQLPRLQRPVSWSSLLLMVWAAGGLPIDLLRVTSLIAPGLMPSGIDWPGLATRALALAVVVVLGRLALARPAAPASGHAGRWYGYAAFALALLYPVLKTWWALGGTSGLKSGAYDLDGSFALWLPAVPWLLAAALSLLLVSTPRWVPRRLLLSTGWFATVVVATFGPAACWSLVSGLAAGDTESGDMATWIFALIYGSWLLWAIAAGAATRSYQLRSAASADVLADTNASAGIDFPEASRLSSPASPRDIPVA